MSAGLRMTEEEYTAHLSAVRQRPTYENHASSAVVAPTSAIRSRDGEFARLKRADELRKQFQALGRLPKGRMNKTEAAYAQVLEQERAIGTVLWWKFHPMNVRLGNNAFYEVDFLVLRADGLLEIRETKGGHTTDKGQLKIKACAAALPIIRIVKITKLPLKQGGGWQLEDFSE